MEWISLGWRDILLLLVVMAAIYLVVMLVKLTQLGRRAGVSDLPDRVKREEPPVAVPPPAPVEPVIPPLTEQTPLRRPAAVPLGSAYEWEEVKSLFGEMEAPPAATAEPTAAQRSGGFGEHLAEHLARSDVEMEMQRMKSEMEQMRAEVESLRAASRVSPQYAEAMELAQRGLTAQDLADRLDISLGEAELVHALSRSERNFDEGEQHGADPYARGRSEYERQR